MDCDPDVLDEPRTFPIGIEAMVASPSGKGVIVQWNNDNGEAIVELDRCGGLIASYVDGLADSFNAGLALNGAGTRVYYVHEMGFDQELRWFSYPDVAMSGTAAPLSSPRSLAVDPKDQFVLFAVNGGDAFKVPFAAPDMPVLLGFDPTPQEFAIAPDGLTAAYKIQSGDVFLWDLGSDKTTLAFSAPTTAIYPLVWVGEHIYHLQDVDGQFDILLRTYNPTTKEIVDVVEVDPLFFALAVAPDESWYARGNGLEITFAPLP